jgi:hypothetical protein
MRLSYENTSSLMRPHMHGRHPKDMIVLHETVSGDIPGWGDINGVADYLARKDYGIHGLTDYEGRIAWARGLGDAIFWQCGGVNERSIGIEQVSRVMLQAPTSALRREIWAARLAEIRATAKLTAAISRARGIPLVYSNGLRPGVTSHWDVSQHFAASEGHTDCWPVHKGGYYPILTVIRLAKLYKAAGWQV